MSKRGIFMLLIAMFVFMSGNVVADTLLYNQTFEGAVIEDFSTMGGAGTWSIATTNCKQGTNCLLLTGTIDGQGGKFIANSTFNFSINSNISVRGWYKDVSDAANGWGGMVLGWNVGDTWANADGLALTDHAGGSFYLYYEPYALLSANVTAGNTAANTWKWFELTRVNKILNVSIWNDNTKAKLASANSNVYNGILNNSGYVGFSCGGGCSFDGIEYYSLDSEVPPPPAGNQTPTPPQDLLNISQNNQSVYLNSSGSCHQNCLLYQDSVNVVNFSAFPYNRTGLTNATQYQFYYKVYNTTYTTNLSNASNTLTTTTYATPKINSVTTSLIANTNTTANPLLIYYNFTYDGVVGSQLIGDAYLLLNGTITMTSNNVNISKTNNFSLVTTGFEEGYNITLKFNNSLISGQKETLNVFFDTIVPTLNQTGITNNSVYVIGWDNLISFSFTCADTNLFACNASIVSLNTTGQINATLNNSFLSNLAGATTTLNISRLVNTLPAGAYAAYGMAADSHTTQAIGLYKEKKLPDGVEFENSIKITSADLKSSLVTIKRKDRYSFVMAFIKPQPEIYVESTGELVYLPNSAYKAHFVDYDNKKWIDFEGGSDVEVTKITNNKYKVKMLNPTKTEYSFNSIGDLNVEETLWYFNVTANNVSLEYVIKDEDNPTNRIYADGQYSYAYWSVLNPAVVYNNTGTFTNVTFFTLNHAFNESNVSANLYVIYNTSNGFTNRYIISNTTIQAGSFGNTTLYGLATQTGITDLKITLRYNANFNYYPNIITKLQRRYTAENVWRNVQYDESGEFGLIFFNIREETTDYRLIFTDLNNNILKTTGTTIFVCDSGVCDLTTLLEPYSSTSTAETLVKSYSYNNNTGILTLTWNSPSATTTTTRLSIIQERASGTLYLYNTTQTAAGGNFSVNLSTYTGNVNVLFLGEGDIIINDYLEVGNGKIGSLIGNQEGALWTAMLMVLSAGFGVFSPAGAIITTLISLIVAYLLGIFTPLTLTFIIIACIIGVVIGFKVKS